MASDDIYVRVGRRLRAIRDQRGYTQAQLADFASLAREHLSELENGRKEIGIRTLERLVQALGLQLQGVVQGNLGLVQRSVDGTG